MTWFCVEVHSMGKPPPWLHSMLTKGRAEDQGAWGWHLLESVFSASLIKVGWPCSFKSWMRWKRARVQAEAIVAVLEGLSLATKGRALPLVFDVQVKVKRVLGMCTRSHIQEYSQWHCVIGKTSELNKKKSELKRRLDKWTGLHLCSGVTDSDNRGIN